MEIVSSAAALGTAALLDRLGLGASKKADFFIPDTSLQQLRNRLIIITSQQGWGLLKEQEIDKHLVITVQVGQWGLSMSGAQRLAVALIETSGGVQGSATSKSIMGQLADWGANQKNLNILIDNLTHFNNKDGAIASGQLTFPKPKPLISPKFYIIIGIGFILIAIIQVILGISLNFHRQAALKQVNEEINQGSVSMNAQLEARQCQPEISADKIKIGFKPETDSLTIRSLLQQMGASGCEKCNHDWLLICHIDPRNQFMLTAQFSNNPNILFLAP